MCRLINRRRMRTICQQGHYQRSSNNPIFEYLHCVTFGAFPTVLDLSHTYIHTHMQLKTFIHLTNGVVSDSSCC